MPGYISKLLKAGISASLLVYLVAVVDTSEMVRHIASAHHWLIATVFVGYLLSQVLSAYKWRVLARPLGFSQPQRVFTVCYFAGMYLNLFAPSTVAGDLGRGLLLARRRGRRVLAINSVLADRASGLGTLLLIGAVALLLHRSYPIPSVIYYAPLVGALGIALGWRLIPRAACLILRPDNRLRVMIERDLADYWRNHALILKVVGLSAVFHCFQIGLQYILATSLRISIPAGYFFLFFPIVTVLSTLPVSFSGVGLREGGYVFFLGFVGVTEEQALAMGLLWTAVILASGLAGGLALLLSQDLVLAPTEKEGQEELRQEAAFSRPTALR